MDRIGIYVITYQDDKIGIYFEGFIKAGRYQELSLASDQQRSNYHHNNNIADYRKSCQSARTSSSP